MYRKPSEIDCRAMDFSDAQFRFSRYTNSEIGCGAVGLMPFRFFGFFSERYTNSEIGCSAVGLVSFREVVKSESRCSAVDFRGGQFFLSVTQTLRSVAVQWV